MRGIVQHLQQGQKKDRVREVHRLIARSVSERDGEVAIVGLDQRVKVVEFKERERRLKDKWKRAERKGEKET